MLPGRDGASEDMQLTSCYINESNLELLLACYAT